MTAGPLPRRVEAPGLLGLLALAALLLGRRLGAPSTEFDEQVYLATADLLARGAQLGQDVFTSQPPLFATLLDGAYGLVGGEPAALRGIAVATALAGTVCGWWVVRELAGARAALGTAALLVLAPGVVDAAAVVSADVPCVALGTAALAAAHAARRHPAWAFAAGVLLAAALLVKLLAAPFALAVAAVLLTTDGLRANVLRASAGAAAVVLAVGLAHVGALGAIWDGAVVLHLDAREAEATLPPGGVPAAAVALFVAAYLGLLLLLAAGLASVPPAERRAWAHRRIDLIVLLVGGVALCLVQRPLLHHHLVVIGWPLALLAGSALPARLSRAHAGFAVAALALAAPLAVVGRTTVEPPEQAALERAAAIVRADTPSGRPVASDLPLVALLAERPSAAATVDPSYVRLSTGSLSDGAVVRAARGAGAVVAGRSFRRRPRLMLALLEAFPRRVEAGGGISVLLPARSARRARR